MKLFNFKLIVLFVGAGLIYGCGTGQDKSKEKKIEFQMATVPAMLTDPGARADYLALHWWDNFDFTDTAYLSHPEVTEQALANYLSVLPHASQAKMAEGLKKMMQSSEADSTVYAYFREKAEMYLWDPNSPARNEEMYIPVLESILGSAKASELIKEKARYQLNLVMKNRPGTKAADFVYTLESGRESKLSAINSEYTMIFFNNPGCPACADIIREIKLSPFMNNLESRKTGGRKVLTILTVYPDDDLEAWRKYLPDLPADWINSHDNDIEELYDLKAIPTLYLLDKDKTVLLKDANYPVLEEYLYDHVKIQD